MAILRLLKLYVMRIQDRAIPQCNPQRQERDSHPYPSTARERSCDSHPVSRNGSDMEAPGHGCDVDSVMRRPLTADFFAAGAAWVVRWA